MDDYHLASVPRDVVSLLDHLGDNMDIKVVGPFKVGDQYTFLKRERHLLPGGRLIKAADSHYTNLAKILGAGKRICQENADDQPPCEGRAFRCP